jgi:hypothetical protein
MALVCIVSVFAVIAVVLYSICAASSDVHRRIGNRTLLFQPPDFAKPFEDLLAEGDVESVYRIVKGLAQRGDIEIIETEKEIIITRLEPLSEDVETISMPGMML